MGRIIVLAVVLLAAFVTGIVIGQTGGDDMVSTSALDAETSKVTQLQNQVAQLEGDLRTAREQLQVAQAATPPATDTRAGDPNSTTRGGDDSDDSGDGDPSSTTKPKSPTTTTKSASGSDSTGESTTYTVKAGENLWSVANNVYGNAGYWRTIAEANGITSKTPLSPGRKLKIPPKPNSAGSSDSSSSGSSGSSSSGSSSSGSSSSGSSSSGSSVD